MGFLRLKINIKLVKYLSDHTSAESIIDLHTHKSPTTELAKYFQIWAPKRKKKPNKNKTLSI